MSNRHIAIAAFFPIAIRDSATGGTMINPDWQRVSGAGAKVKIAVAEGSTKDLQDDPTFPPFHPLTDAKNQFDACRAQRQLVLGYVSTRGARRSRTDIDADINKWYTSFTDANGIHIDGIFFDEGPELDLKWDSGPKAGQFITDQEFQDFYKTLIHDFKTNHTSNNKALLNASQFPNEWVMQPVDAQGNSIDYVILWENSESLYVDPNTYKAIGPTSLLNPPSWWTDTQYTDRISHTIYLCPQTDLQNIINLSQTRNAGNVYIYDRDPNQPGVGYGFLPSYWDGEVANV
jgi:hypothetical protein